MAFTDREDLNYLGELFLVGQRQTPFLSMIGDVGGANTGRTASFIYPMASPWDTGSPSQPAITEAASVSSNTATTITRSQDTNTVQIFQETVEVSYAKQSTYGEISGLASTSTLAGQQVNDELAFQRMAHLKKMANNIEYSMLQGSYQAASDSTTAAKTRGLITGITSNAVAASSADLSVDLFNELLRTMWAAGAPFENSVILVNAFQKQALSKLYGYAPESRNVGGVNINQIETDFAVMGVAIANNVPTDTLVVADMAFIRPVVAPVPGAPGGGILFYEPLAKTAASEKGQFYTQMGIDYAAEEFHGKITGLATS